MYSKTGTDLKNLQSHGLYILKYFAEFAEKHDLKYSLGFGSLLGAIRHDGFIPWDDDIDVVMPREDYEHFLEISKTDYSDEFFIQNHLTEKNNFHFFTRICLNKTEAIQHHYKYIENHKGIFIDLFPADYAAPSDKQEAHVKKMLFIKLLKRIPGPNPNKKDIIINYLARIFPCYLSHQNLNKRLDKLAQKYNGKDSQYLYIAGDSTSKTTEGLFYYYKGQFPAHSFKKLIKHQFEDSSFFVFENYHEVLTMQYGDYQKLPKKEDRTPHHGFESFVFRDDLISKDVSIEEVTHEKP